LTINEELCLHLAFSQGAMMMRAFLSKPNVLQGRSVEEASEAIAKVPHESEAIESPSTSMTRTPDPTVTNEISTGYISDLEEDEDKARDSLPDGTDTRERSQPVAGSSSCARRNPKGTNDANSIDEEWEEVEGSF